ncbi:MAG: hypothetical protein ICCCNLDF_00313 [Planctomycetes bacterium]|nr:hypothetical protein [Planctomycetota bacterium]
MAGYNQQGGYPPQNNPQQPVGGNYPQGPYQGPPVGGNYPRGPYQGPPPGPAPYPQQYAGQGPNPYGMANPNMGVTPGLVTAGFWLALFPCTAKIGLILCALGMGEAKKRQAGEGLAMAGIIIGAVWLLGMVVLYVAASVAEASGSL